ncbi:hypothetical protein MATL_G00021620 [Megalops atlanticus]|uniref:Shisa N-terminal domain-containing protein n=1 Tax=Megalops atlanticus TaxID=7932 RepID=A0A9D3TJB0_MEGAT|nr:hypothetical protein MATL_G00021620 [Megalops atlanticus]
MRGGSVPMSLTVVMTLLLAIIDVKASGEYCHGWRDSQGAWREGFQCPERFDSEEAIICCGKCELRYCCTSSEARLDQGTCDNDKQSRDPGSGGRESKDNGAAALLQRRGAHRAVPTAVRTGLTRPGGAHSPPQNALPVYSRAHSLQSSSSSDMSVLCRRRCRVCLPSRLMGVAHLRALPDRGRGLRGLRPAGLRRRRVLLPLPPAQAGAVGRGGGGGGAEPGGAGRLLETIPMMASRGSSSRQSSTATSSSSSAQSGVRPPLLRAQAGCCLPPDAPVYVSVPPSFSLLSCQQGAPLLHPQYIGYALPHEPAAASPAPPFLHPPQAGYRPLQSPFPPSGGADPRTPPVTV